MSPPKRLSAQSTDIANFPLATVEPDKPLPLIAGINPAWQKQIEALREQAIVPLIRQRRKASPPRNGQSFAPGLRRLRHGRRPSRRGASRNWVWRVCARLPPVTTGGDRQLISMDKAVETEVKAIRSVEQLLRFRRDLFKLVNNFVSFRSFYTGRDKAIFQVGTLYLDGRSCDLCVGLRISPSMRSSPT